jgi:hypothetical protein
MKTNKMKTIISLADIMDFEPSAIKLPNDLQTKTKVHLECEDDELAFNRLNFWKPIEIQFEYQKKYFNDIVYRTLEFIVCENDLKFLIIEVTTDEGRYVYKLSDVKFENSNVSDDSEGYLKFDIVPTDVAPNEMDDKSYGLKFLKNPEIIRDNPKGGRLISVNLKAKITSIDFCKSDVETVKWTHVVDGEKSYKEID